MICRTKGRMVLCIALLCLNLAFIWGNSLLDGQASGALSNWIRDFLGNFLPISQSEQSGHILRKLAHFSEFASLGALAVWLVSMLGARTAICLALPLCGGFAAACIDEAIQSLSPGRCPSPVDVGIDTAGVATGILLLFLGYHIYRKIHEFKEKTS